MSEESENLVSQEGTAAVMGIQQNELDSRVREKCLYWSPSSGYESGENEDSDVKRMSNGTDDLISDTIEFDVRNFMKDSGHSQKGASYPNDVKDEISVDEQVLSKVTEFFEYSEWITEEKYFKYADLDHTVLDKVFSSIPPDDLCKIDNLTLEFDPCIREISEENDSRVKHPNHAEEITTLCEGLYSGPLNIDKLMDESLDELENKIHCHKISLVKIVADILKMTKEAEDSIEENAEQQLTAAFDEVLEFHQEAKLADESPLVDHCPEIQICDSEECTAGVRKPNETPSEFLSNVNSSVQFFHGFCSGYQAPSRHNYIPQHSCVDNLGPCSHGEWCCCTECLTSEHSFHSRMSSHTYLPTEMSSYFKMDGSGENTSQLKIPPWLNEGPNILPEMRVRPSSDTKVEQLLETSCKNSFFSSELAVSSTSVEDFVNSLYLPKDLLPSEITSGATAKKYESPVFSHLFDDSVNAIKSSSSEGSLSAHSWNSYTEKLESSEIYNTNIWGDEKETYWKPLPVCPAPSEQRSRPADNSRASKGRKFRTPSSTTRNASRSRGWLGANQRKYNQ